MAEQIGEITIMHGSATAEGPDGVRELTLGSPIYNNDVISTAGKSAIEIEFTDGALLSQGANSKVHLDDYVFDPEQDAGEITMNLLEGTFRSVTGQIVDMNPEGFHIDTPNTTIGIRGTTTGHTIGGDGEETHVVLDFVDKPVAFTSRADGVTQIITRDGYKITATATGISSVERATPKELAQFEQLSTRSMEQSPPPQDDDDDDDRGDGDSADGGSDEEGGGEGELELTPDGFMDEDGVIGNVGEMPIELPYEGGAREEIEEQMEMLEVVPDQQALPDVPEVVVLPPAEEPEDTEDIPLAVVETLDLKDFSAPLTAVLPSSPGYYYPTADPGDSTPIESTVVNLIGAQNYANDITGNEHANVLTGGTAQDTISGLDGNDLIFGGGDNDTIDGGNDNDTLYGGDGNDSMAGSDGNDSMLGGDGNDTMSGGAQWDVLYGGNGNDSMDGGTYDDVLHGEAGDDSISGGDNDDALYGEGGHDSLTGGAHKDTLYGGDDNDTLDGGTHDDILYGGNGDDSLFGGDDSDILYGGNGADTLNGGSGGTDMDYVSYQYSTAGVVVSSWNTGASNDGYGNADTFIDIEGFIGSDYGDNVSDNSGNAVTHHIGNGGDDTLTVYSSAQTTLEGGADNDILALYNGPLAGSVFDGGADHDILQNSGNSSLDFTTSTILNIEEIRIFNNSKTLTFNANQVNTSWKLDAYGTGDTLQINMGSATSLNASGFTFGTNWDNNDKVKIVGDSDNESIIGSSNIDYILGGDGNDTIKGGMGSDTLDGGNGSADKLDYVGSGAINGNLQTGSITHDSVYTDTISNFEVFVGSCDGNNILLANGYTSITGGTGIDIFTFYNQDVQNTFINGSSGTSDALHFTGGTVNLSGTTFSGFEALLLNAGSATSLTLDADSISGKTWHLDVRDDNVLNVIGDIDVQTLDMSQFASFTLNSTGQTNVNLGGGNDTLNMGTNMSDQVHADGGADTDVLQYTDDGIAANVNELFSVTGFETILFGNADTYVEVNSNLTAGNAVIIDGRNITGGVNALHFSAAGDSNGVAYTIYGSEGDDEIEGGQGNDTIYGGLGDDLLDGGMGVDSLFGGAGNDTFTFHGSIESGDKFDGGADLDRFKVVTSTHFGNSAGETGIEELEINSGQTATFDFGMDGFLTGLETIYGSGTANVETIIVEGTGGNDSFDIDTAAPSYDASWGAEDVFTIQGMGGQDTIVTWEIDTLINGGLGADTLTGGAGSDTFYYLSSSEGGDTVHEFSHTNDSFSFEGSNFFGFTGTLDAGHFYSSQAALDGDSQTDAAFIFDGNDLYYDDDGSGGNAGLHIATINVSEGTFDNTDITFV